MPLMFGLLLAPHAIVEVMGDVIVNEIELGPIKGEAQWVELYNPTDLPISLVGLELQLHSSNAAVLIPFSGGGLLESGEYRVVHIQDVARDFNGTQNITVMLLDRAESLDVVEGVGDGLEDDKTWQRFPDSTDSDAFTDWTFRTTTKGQGNGNLGQVVAECSLDPFCWGPLDVFFHNEHRVAVDDRIFLIETFYNTKRIEVDFVLEEKKIVISQEFSNFPQLGAGPSFMHVTIPDELLGGSYSVFADGKQKPIHTVTGQASNRLIIDGLEGEGIIEIIGTRVIPEFSSGSIAIVMVLVFSGLATYRHYTSRIFF